MSVVLCRFRGNNTRASADKGDLLPVVQRGGPELQRPGRSERRCRQHAAQGESLVILKHALQNKPQEM